MYVTFNVSPNTTARSPGAEKSAAENSIPVVPPLVLLEIKNAPPIVSVALIANEAGDKMLLMTDGLAVVAAPNVHVGRVALLYGKTSVHPAWDAEVSPAAGLLDAAAPYRPMYQVAVAAVPEK